MTGGKFKTFLKHLAFKIGLMTLIIAKELTLKKFKSLRIILRV